MEITFQNKKFSVETLVKVSAFSHLETVSKSKIITLAAAKYQANRIAIKVGDMYHLLTGQLDPDSDMQQLTVITKHVLAKAQVDTSTYQQRTTPISRPPYQRSFNTNDRQTTFSQKR